jgi:release factor glutamine methyltransferase
MTIQEAYKKTLFQLYEIYDKRESENIANMVIEKVTEQKKIERIINQTFLLNNIQLTQLEDIIHQLLQHKPIQYILNETWFAGMKFYVNEHVLIPRPETEELAMWVIEDLKNILQGENINYYLIDNPKNLQILDIGTGSGCISVTLQKKIRRISTTSIDISNDALEVAKKNAVNNNVPINFLLMDFLDQSQWNFLSKFDVIISNPPYIRASERKEMNKNVLDFEPHLALFVPDNDPLLFYKNIALFGKKYLTQKGRIYVEINEALEKEVSMLFLSQNYTVELKKDLQGKNRMLKAISS